MAILILSRVLLGKAQYYKTDEKQKKKIADAEEKRTSDSISVILNQFIVLSVRNDFPERNAASCSILKMYATPHCISQSHCAELLSRPEKTIAKRRKWHIIVRPRSKINLVGIRF